ncbi:MlaD family protein [Patulibacter defluvii]|uniref:MlaD family protein n=1 Tax=Patulibacter defluvii TaxID=3095358 RepID=UPI002A76465E|nr:MlaD family protein [Patulibacter sp. DM4]
MRRVLRSYGRWVAVMAVMAAMALAVTVYMLAHQRVAFPSWMPGVGKDLVSYRAAFQTSQSVTPGQGQTVTIAGIDVGDITAVELHGGRAIVDFRIKRKYAGMMRRDASALLRPKTGLNDMVLELDPGTPSSPPVKAGYTIAVSRTAPNVNVDEILASLDTDTRGALQMLLQGGGQGLGGAGAKRLSGGLREIQPVTANLRRIGEALEDRRRNTARAVHSIRLITEELAARRGDLVRAVDGTDAVFSTIAGRDRELRQALRDLPPTLRTTQAALRDSESLAEELRPATAALLPVARQLRPSLAATRPFLRQTEPVLRKQLLPFTRETLPTVRKLRAAARDTAEIAPDATATLKELNKAANMLAYDPPGEEQGYLFWAQWLTHLAPWIFNTQDAHGPIRRGNLMITCSTLGSFGDIAQVNPVGGLLTGIFRGLSGSGLCPIGPGGPDGDVDGSTSGPRAQRGGDAASSRGGAGERRATPRTSTEDRATAAAAAGATTGGQR